MTTPEQIAQQFCQFYYDTFDTDRSKLGTLYRQNSVLTFETNDFTGVTDISKKLQELPFERIKHAITTSNAQPCSLIPNALIVLVTGQLQFDDAPAPTAFSQAFLLAPEGGSFYVANDVFRLIYPGQ